MIPPPARRPRANMPTARGLFGTSAVGGTIYAIGGTTIGRDKLAVVEADDTATDTWTRRADTISRSSAQVRALAPDSLPGCLPWSQVVPGRSREGYGSASAAVAREREPCYPPGRLRERAHHADSLLEGRAEGQVVRRLAPHVHEKDRPPASCAGPSRGSARHPVTLPRPARARRRAKQTVAGRPAASCGRLA